MSNEFVILAGTAATIGFVHTILGPDHYLPFIVMSKSRQWSIVKLAIITILCGIGHVLSSIILGFIGIALGIAVFKLQAVESIRGELSAWLLMAFGFSFFVWGIYRVIRNHPYRHNYLHNNENAHLHSHKHIGNHAHVHSSKYENLTPWVLFAIFVFGPCEPLIPLLMYPASKGNMLTVTIIASIFGVITIATMLCVILISSYGLSKLPLNKLEKYSHALAGLTIFLCGGTIKFLGI